MPKIHYENAGEVLKHEFLRGVIQTVDSETDTCTVIVSGRTVDALLFYHCEPESVIRDNGAITGAAAGFAEDDAVIVQTNRDDPTEYLVVAHLDGVKKCAQQCVLFYIGPIAVVWDCKNNKVFDVSGVTFPCLKTNAAFVAWLATKESDETAHTLFNLNTESGNYAGSGAETVGCPQLCSEVDEYEYVNGQVYVGYCDYWDAYAGTQTRYDLVHSCRSVGERSNYRTAYGTNLLPGGSGFVGVRTSYERSIITSISMPYGDDVEPDAPWSDTYHSTTIFQYYGILESGILYEFEGSEDWPAEYARSNYGWPFMSTSRVLTNTVPPWAVGSYSDKVIAFCTIMQTIPATHLHGDTNGIYENGGVVSEYEYDERVIKIQAVASFFESGTTGKQYKAFASNAALNAKLIQAAEMYYDLFSIPATTVEWLIPEIRILK